MADKAHTGAEREQKIQGQHRPAVTAPAVEEVGLPGAYIPAIGAVATHRTSKLNAPRLLAGGHIERARTMRQLQQRCGNEHVERLIKQGNKVSPTSSNSIARSPVLNRQTCACGGNNDKEEECDGCKASRTVLQPSPSAFTIVPISLPLSRKKSDLAVVRQAQGSAEWPRMSYANHSQRSTQSASIQRDPASGSHNEAGAVGSIQYCVDVCSGDWRVSGWIWAGIGRRLGRTFVGYSIMREGTLMQGNEPSLRLVSCGECANECNEGETSGWAHGPAFFPKIFGPNPGRKVLTMAGLECGVLLSRTNPCQGSIEGICFLNVIDYLGPIGRSITLIAERLRLEAKAGIDGGFTLTLCKGANGGIVTPRGELCLGGFIEVGRDLSRNKQDYT